MSSWKRSTNAPYAWGDSSTGEHGVGLTAKNYLDRQMSAAEIGLLKRIKQAFDPKGILNPGKIFPDEDRGEPG